MGYGWRRGWGFRMDERKILPRWMLWVAVPSIMALTAVLWGTPFRLSPVYYTVMILLGIGVLRPRLSERLQRLPGPVWLRYILLGYAAVVVEESLVGTLFTLAEGAGPLLWLTRMTQFIAFNLFAFSGAIWGLGFAYGRWPGLRHWHFWLAGLWGLFAEQTLVLLVQNPIAGLILIAPNMVVYAIILAPAMLSLPPKPGTPVRIWSLPLAWGIMLVFSVAPVLGLMALRGAYPDAFPACVYIAC